MVKVLLADDDSTSRALLARWLSGWGYEPVIARDGDQAWELLESTPEVQLCVIDWMMPGLTGPEICERLRAAHPTDVLTTGGRYVYVILLTGRSDKEDLVAGMEAGADDYIRKPCHPSELEVRLRAGRRIVELEKKLIETQARLEVEASHDALTGTLNRKAIFAELSRELARGVRLGESVSVLMLDVDHFKCVNDEEGHQGGDAVLRQLLPRVSSSLRGYDRVGRYGGEEFLIILGRCSLGAAEGIAERIRASVAARPFALGSRERRVTVSIGVASSEAGNWGPEQLVRAADRALYRAKGSGRDRVERAGDDDLVASTRLPERTVA